MILLLLSCTTDTSIIKNEDQLSTIRYSPSSLSFTAGMDPQTVTVESTGNADLDVSSFSIAGKKGFQVVSPDGKLPGLLAAGESADLVVSWEAKDNDVSDVLSIFSNDAGLPEAQVALAGVVDPVDSGTTDSGDSGDSGDTGDSGTTATPNLSLSSSYDFGSLTLGTAASGFLTLHNGGLAADTIENLRVNDSHFQILTATPFDIAPGADVLLSVSFSPDAAVAYQATLTVEALVSADLTATLTGSGMEVIQANTFVWTGSPQQWTVPAGTHSVTLKAWGAGGGAGNETGGSVSAGGGGGFATVTVSVSPGDVLTVRPGQGGIKPGGGGGASIVSRSDGSYLLVAGGGGGGGTDGGSALTQAGNGGAGGGEDGLSQIDNYWGYATGGSAGSGTAAGGVGVLYTGSGVPCPGEAGSSLYGGGGAYGWSSCSVSTGALEDAAGTASSNGAGGGGGAGWIGGGGGGSLYTYFGGGGGGGSSYPTAGAISGSGINPANTTDPDYSGSWGMGGTPGKWPNTPSTDGLGGYVVIQ